MTNSASCPGRVLLDENAGPPATAQTHWRGRTSFAFARDPLALFPAGPPSSLLSTQALPTPTSFLRYLPDVYFWVASTAAVEARGLQHRAAHTEGLPPLFPE